MCQHLLDHHCPGENMEKTASQNGLQGNSAAILKPARTKAQFGTRSNSSKSRTDEDSCKSQITSLLQACQIRNYPFDPRYPCTHTMPFLCRYHQAKINNMFVSGNILLVKWDGRKEKNICVYQNFNTKYTTMICKNKINGIFQEVGKNTDTEH